MLLQIFEHSIETDGTDAILRGVFCKIKKVSTSSTYGVVRVYISSLSEKVNEIKWGNVVLAFIYKY